MKLLPFRSLAITGLVDRPGTYVTILASEDRSKGLRQRRPSVRRQLKLEPRSAENSGRVFRKTVPFKPARITPRETELSRIRPN